MPGGGGRGGDNAFNGVAPNARGREGEAYVRKFNDIGPRHPYIAPKSKRSRIADGRKGNEIHEVKNVGYQGLTRQLRDYLELLDQEPDAVLYIWVRKNKRLKNGAQQKRTRLSRPLQQKIDDYSGRIRVMRAIP